MTEGVKIKDLPLIAEENLTGAEIIPLGGSGNFGLGLMTLVKMIVAYVKTTIISSQIPIGLTKRTLDIKESSELQTINLENITHQVITPKADQVNSTATIDYVIELVPPANGEYKVRLKLNGARSLNLQNSSGGLLTELCNVAQPSNDETKIPIFDVVYSNFNGNVMATVFYGFDTNTIPR
jgi:hypothetical protein